jgi:hypothetical protein
VSRAAVTRQGRSADALAAARGHRDVEPRRIDAVRTLSAGLFGGLALGVVARAWMRVIADDPEFTWSGTVSIVVGFGVFGVLQANAIRARRRSTGWRISVGRAGGGIGMLPLFVAAGGILAPTVILGGLVAARTAWRPSVRVVVALLACVPMGLVISGIVGDFGASSHTWAGIAGVVALYAVIIFVVAGATFAPRADGYRLPRGVRAAMAVGVLGFAAFALVAGGIE